MASSSLSRDSSIKKRRREEFLALPAPPESSRRRIQYSIAAPDPRFELKVFLPQGGHISFLEERDDELPVHELLRKIKRTVLRKDTGPCINWGPHVYLEDATGKRVQDGEVFSSDHQTSRALFLQDGQPHGTHVIQDMWNVTPDPELLGSLPQEYTLETALADLVDNSLQAVWENQPGQLRLISVTLGEGKITIFDTGPGMDSSAENSIARWGIMGSSRHRDVRITGIGGKPPFLRPYFGMYGFGGLVAAMHLGGVAIVSSKTKCSKKVVSLTLEKDVLMETCKTDRTWKTPGEYRDPTEEELRRSSHGSFTTVEISKLRRNLWTVPHVRCMLKDIYFPYIQCDVADSSKGTTTPVEFEVNGINLAEVDGGETAVTNMFSSNGEPFVVDIKMKVVSQHVDYGLADGLDCANARITCFYFPIKQGKERIDVILDELQKREIGHNETFENFCRVSIRRLGRLLPNARWNNLPFMEPKRKRVDKIPKDCFKRVKAFVDTDAGFVPTTSKMDLLSGNAFTTALRNLGTRGNMPDAVRFSLFQENRSLKLQELEKKYEEWIKTMHELFDEEVDCASDEGAIITKNMKELGFSQNVFRAYSCLNRKGIVWKQGMRLKFYKGLPGQNNKDFYATLEYFLTDGLFEDKGNTKVMCRPMNVPKEQGSSLTYVDDCVDFDLGKSVAVSIEFLTLDRCEVLEQSEWDCVAEKERLRSPTQIDVLDKQIIQSIGLDGGLDLEIKAGDIPFHTIYAVIRPKQYTTFTDDRRSINPLDQKYIFKKLLRMKLQLSLLESYNMQSLTSLDSDCFETITMFVNATTINNIHGIYCFKIQDADFHSFHTRAGKYALSFLVTDDSIPGSFLQKTLELSVLPSEQICTWTLQLGAGQGSQIRVRLGSQIGPLLLHGFDEHGNVTNVKEPRDCRFEVWSGGEKLAVCVSTEGVVQVKDPVSFLVVKAVTFTNGLLKGIAVDNSASLQCLIDNMAAASIKINLFPGEVDFVELFKNQEIDDCLRTGDIIRVFTLKVKDCYGNCVEKGSKISLQLLNLELQDNQGCDRLVDDEGCVKLGGLLRVTGPYNSMAEICVQSTMGKMLYRGQFSLLKRTIQIVPQVPKECTPGAVLQNLEVQIVDENGRIDSTMTGGNHLIRLSCSQVSIYLLEEGSCLINRLQLPDQPGPWSCEVYHTSFRELSTKIEINIVSAFGCSTGEADATDYRHQAGSLESSETDESDGDPLADPTTSDEMNDMADAQVAEGLITLISESQKTMSANMRLIKRGEEELQRLKENKNVQKQKILQLEGELKSLHTQCQSNDQQGSLMDDCERHSLSPEKIVVEICKTSFPARFFVEAYCSGSILSIGGANQCNGNILGVVCLLASTESEQLSRALADFIGLEVMLGLVCDTYEAAKTLVRLHDVDGRIDDSWGLYGYVKSQSKSMQGKLRIYILEDLRPYNKGLDEDDPQKLLCMEQPKLSNDLVPPKGFKGYAVNLICLNDEHLHLRGSLFYNLFRELQVYETQRDLFNARDVLTTGGVSLDGGFILERGCDVFGKREEIKIAFPVFSEHHEAIPALHSLNHVSQILQSRDAITAKKQELKASMEKLSEMEDRMKFVKKKMKVIEEKQKATREQLKKRSQDVRQLEDLL